MWNIPVHRLHNQRLEGTKFQTPGDGVAWLGAVQAQEYAAAKWSLGLRLQGMNDAAIEQAIVEKTILRTHVMRPTWHFVAPADIRWLLDLTAPRVNALNAHYYRRLELDDALFRRSHTALIKALQSGKQLTRQELAAVLRQTGIATDGLRLNYLMMRAELDGIICSGARRGKQFTYALLDEQAPQARTLKREEALAELTKRYFTSHGPATVQDFAWWSGLTTADVKTGLELVGSHLIRETTDGQTYWFSPSETPPKEFSRSAFLLPTYDEFIIGYTDRSAVLQVSRATRAARTGESDSSRDLRYDSMIVIAGQIVGTWRRTFRKGAVVIETSLINTLTAAEGQALAAAESRFGEFLGMPVALA